MSNRPLQGLRPWQIKCRFCRIPFSQDEGCDVCKTVRGNIVWPEMDAQPEDDPKAALRESLRFLKENEKRLKDESPEGMGYNRNLTLLASAITKLAAELAKIERFEADNVRKMTFDEKVDMFVDFYANLPQAPQRYMLKRLAEEQERAEEASKLPDVH